MTTSNDFGKTALKALTFLLSLVSLATLGFGLYHQEWYAGFGLVMFMTSLICNVAAHLGASTNSETLQLARAEVRTLDVRSRKPAVQIDAAS